MKLDEESRELAESQLKFAEDDAATNPLLLPLLPLFRFVRTLPCLNKALPAAIRRRQSFKDLGDD